MPMVKRGPKTDTMRLVESLFETPLEVLLAEWYGAGLRAPEIARRIGAKGLAVTPESVRNWVVRLGAQATTTTRLSFPEPGASSSSQQKGGVVPTDNAAS